MPFFLVPPKQSPPSRTGPHCHPYPGYRLCLSLLTHPRFPMPDPPFPMPNPIPIQIRKPTPNPTLVTPPAYFHTLPIHVSVAHDRERWGCGEQVPSRSMGLRTANIDNICFDAGLILSPTCVKPFPAMDCANAPLQPESKCSATGFACSCVGAETP